MGVYPEDFNRRTCTQDRIVVQYRARHKQGHDVWAEDQGFVGRDRAGTPIRFVGSTTDITEQKQSEIELRESEALFRGGFETEYICKDGTRIPVLLGCAFLPGSRNCGV